MTLPKTIVLKSRGITMIEELLANAAISPGDLIEVMSTGKYRRHSTQGGAAAMIFAKEDDKQGKTIAQDYAATDLVFAHLALPGDLIYGYCPAAATAIIKGNKLISNGDGTFIVPAAAGTNTLYANTAASAAVTSTSTETAFDKSYSIPANTLVAGDVIHISGQVIATATNSTDTLTVKVYLGTTAILNSGAVDVANNDIAEFEADIVIRTIGASGTFVASGEISLGVPGTATTRAGSVGSTAIDTTVANVISVKATWSTANAGNSARLDILTVSRGVDVPQKYLVYAEESVDNSLGASKARIRIRVL